MSPRPGKCFVICVIVLVFACCFRTRRIDADDAYDAPFLEEFEFAPGGDFVVVPVTLEGQTYDFILDTTVERGTVDSTIRDALNLQALSDQDVAKLSNSTSLYRCPKAKIGRIPVSLGESVVVRDLSAIRQKLWTNHVGLVPMTALKSFIVELDFPAGKVRFRSALPSDPGLCLTFSDSAYLEGSSPHLIGRIPGVLADRFMIATSYAGRVGFGEELLLPFLEKGLLSELESTTVLFAGDVSTRNFVWSVKNFEVGSLGECAEDVNMSPTNAIGLGYMSRYIVTFDFPRRRVFLKSSSKSPNISRVRETRLGLELQRQRGRVVIAGVEPGLLGDQSGLRVDDQILRIANEAPTRGSSWNVRQRLCAGWGNTELKIIRDNEEMSIRTRGE